MSWADKHIADLKEGMVVVAKPSGNSMQPLIFSKDSVLIAPPENIQVGDIVLCKVMGKVLLHKVKYIAKNGNDIKYMICNNKGYENGWTKAIYGKALAVTKGKGTYTCK